MFVAFSLAPSDDLPLLNTGQNIMYGNQRNTEILPPSGTDEVGSRFWRNVCHHKGAAGLLMLRREQGLPPNIPLDKVVRRQIVSQVWNFKRCFSISLL